MFRILSLVIICVASMILLAATSAYASQTFHDGSVDLRLKKAVAFNLGGNDEDLATAVATASDGSMVVVGNIAPGAIGVVHLDANGNVTLKSYVSQPAPATLQAAAVALQPDGKVLIAGTSDLDGSGTSYGPQVAVMRLKADSNQLDSTFGSGGFESSTVFGNGTAMTLAADGSIWVAGYFDNVAPYGYEFSVLHLTSGGNSTTGTGYFDFDRGGDNADEARAITIMPDGGVLVVGNVRIGTGANAFGLLKLNGTTGVPDPNFGNIGVDGETVFRLDQATACPDNPKAVSMGYAGFSDRIYVAGTHCQGQTDSQFALVAFNTDGTPDTSFGTQGVELATFSPGAPYSSYIDDAVTSMAIWDSYGSPFPVPIDHIVLAGNAQTSGTSDRDMALMRFDNNGSIDTSFGNAGSGSTAIAYPVAFGYSTSADSINALALDHGDNGRDLIAAGYAQTASTGTKDFDFAIVRVLNGDRIFWDGLDGQ